MVDKYQFHYNYSNPLETKFTQFKRSYERFLDAQKYAGFLLIISILCSLTLVNLPLMSEYYHNFAHLSLGFHIGDKYFSFTLKDLVNDFLLVIFFFILGLEIKREFVCGHLADIKRAGIVMLAALGGIVMPLLIYLSLNAFDEDLVKGWAIPIATDTAIAIGVMSFFKSRLPRGAFIFIAALAVLDDLVAVIVIAGFYTDHLNWVALFWAVIVTMVLIICNLLGQRNPGCYLVAGFILWYLFEQSGVHPSVAGVIIAFTTPARPKDTPHYLVYRMKYLLKRFEKKHDKRIHILESRESHSLLELVTQESLDATTPLRRWESKLQKPVLLVILPLFALTNGAVEIDAAILHASLESSLFWGVFLGLFLGKPLGIILFTWLGLKCHLGKLSTGMTMKTMLGLGFIAGIGYTMSVFIADLSFVAPEHINTAKLAIVMASLFAALAGGIIVMKNKPVGRRL